MAVSMRTGASSSVFSDGMGSGLDANRESETVVELFEQFLRSGFSRETAARMINSALVLQRSDGMFSTVDLCSIDLYSGVCSFLKAGAAATFIRRDTWVESIVSTSLAAGLMQQMDFDTASRKLYDGDYLIMVTDGVLDALEFGRGGRSDERTDPGNLRPGAKGICQGAAGACPASRRLSRQGRHDGAGGAHLEKIESDRVTVQPC